jgi:hypothetical protein
LTPEGERGQLILVGGVALALVFVALGVLLNSAAFTGAEAARNGAADADSALSLRDDAVEGVGGAMFYVNNDSWERGYPGLVSELRAETGVWAGAVSNTSATHRSLADARVVDWTNGTQIYQAESRNFTAKNGTADWALVSNGDGVRRFGVEVDADGPLPARSSAFEVVFKNDTESEEVLVYDDGSGVVVEWPTEAGTATCDTGVSSGTVSVSLTSGAILDGSCADSPPPFPTIEGPYDIRYRNADEVTGGYSLVVAHPLDGVRAGGAYNNNTDDPPPHAVAALYNATVAVSFTSATLSYNGTGTTAPAAPPGLALTRSGGGASDGGARSPDLVSPVAPPPPRPLVFAGNTSEQNLVTYRLDGTRRTLPAPGIRAVGRGETDLDDDGSREIPYINDSGALALIDGAGEKQVLVGNARRTRVGVGSFAGAPESVYYINESDNQHIYRATVTDTGTTTTKVFDVRGHSVAGMGDIDGDGDDELVYLGTSATLSYVEPDGSTSSMGGYSSISSASTVGPPADFDGNGVATVPLITGSSNVQLRKVDGTAKETTTNDNTLATGGKYPPTHYDVDEDDRLEVVFVSKDGYLRAVDIDKETQTLEGPDGERIDVTPNVGVA